MAMGYLETLLGENCVLTAAWDLAVEDVRTLPSEVFAMNP